MAKAGHCGFNFTQIGNIPAIVRATNTLTIGFQLNSEWFMNAERSLFSFLNQDFNMAPFIQEANQMEQNSIDKIKY